MRANGKEKGGQDRGKWHISASNIRMLLIRTMRLKCHTYTYDKGDQPSGGETTGQILERHDLAEDDTRQANLEVTY